MVRAAVLLRRTPSVYTRRQAAAASLPPFVHRPTSHAIGHLARVAVDWRRTVKLADRTSLVLRVLAHLTIGLLVMGYAAGALSAQVLYGSIAGTLTDETGAVVPNAVVSVKNTSTGLARQVTTDEAGYYSIPNLAEGTYDLSVTATGFGPYRQTGVPVPINAVTRVDITLRVGAIAEQVSVEASSAVLQTTKVGCEFDPHGA